MQTSIRSTSEPKCGTGVCSASIDIRRGLVLDSITDAQPLLVLKSAFELTMEGCMSD